MSATRHDLLVALVAAAAPGGIAKMASTGVLAAPVLGIPQVIGLATALLVAEEKRADLSSDIGKTMESGAVSYGQARGSLLGKGVDFVRKSPTAQRVLRYGDAALTGLSLLSVLNPVTAAVRAGGGVLLKAALKKIGAGLLATTAATMAAGRATSHLLKSHPGWNSYLSNVLNPEGNAAELLKLHKWKTTVDSLDALRKSSLDMFGGKLPAVPDPYRNVVTKESQFAEDAAPDATIAQLIRAIQVSGSPGAQRDLLSLQSAIGMTPVSARLASVFGVALVANLAAKYLGAGPVGRSLFSLAAGLGAVGSSGNIHGSSVRYL